MEIIKQTIIEKFNMQANIDHFLHVSALYLVSKPKEMNQYIERKNGHKYLPLNNSQIENIVCGKSFETFYTLKSIIEDNNNMYLKSIKNTMNFDPFYKKINKK